MHRTPVPHWALPKWHPFLHSQLGEQLGGQEAWDGFPFSSLATTHISPVESSYWTSVKSVSSPLPISKKKNKPLCSPCPTWKVSETFYLVFCSESYLHLQYSFHVTLGEVSNNQSNPEKEQSWRHHTYWLQTILQSYINPTVQYWHGSSHIDQWNRMESPEIDPHTYGSVNIWQGNQEYSMGKGQSLQ